MYTVPSPPQTVTGAAVVAANTLDAFKSGKFDFGQLGFDPDEIQVESAFPDPNELVALYEFLDPLEKREFDKLIAAQGRMENPLMPHQIVPWWRDDWEVMALNGGRGVGKTLCGATAVIEHLENVGSRARAGIGAPTNADVRDVCLEGETGLMTLYGHRFRYWNRSQGLARHVKGGLIKAMGTEKPRRWNGPQWSFLWFDELSLCNRKAVDDALMGLRLGPRSGPFRARMVATMTPKGQKWIEELLSKGTTYVPHYIGPDGNPRFPTTFDNPYLPPRRVQLLKEQYMNTRLGLQELLGMFIGDVPGALWRRDIIKVETDDEKWPRFTRIVVAIDPAGSSARRYADANALTEEDRANMRRNSSTSICVLAKGADNRIYILAWVAGRWTPGEWANKAIGLYHMLRADRFVVERNFGGDMVADNLRTVWREAPISEVHASRGKDVRAEPVVTLYEQGRVIHCVAWPDAENQLCSYVDATENEGADYMDAMVWGVYELMGWDMMGQSFSVPVHSEELAGFSVNIFV